MSLASLLNRVVAVESSTAGVRDRYGNATYTNVTVADVPARADRTGQNEDEDDRDLQSRTIRYTLALTSLAGIAIAPAGRGHLLDDGDRWEIVGEPELVYRKRRPHHWELDARRVTG